MLWGPGNWLFASQRNMNGGGGEVWSPSRVAIYPLGEIINSTPFDSTESPSLGDQLIIFTVRKAIFT